MSNIHINSFNGKASPMNTWMSMELLERIEESLQEELETRVNQLTRVDSCSNPPENEEELIYSLEYHFQNLDIAAETVWPNICNAVFEIFDDEDELIERFGDRINFSISIETDPPYEVILTLAF